ncbi:MAG TPA: hypothetical protein VEB03_01080 [Candidatus Nanoarchaeia archaeon]|nr:hypothetical protein [Candidatus Nanoarchaeia archaeon]
MICTLIAAALFLFQSPMPVTATKPQSDAATSKVADTQQSDKSKTLQKVRRIYVDTFGTTEAAQQLQAMLVASLTGSKRLTVTEDKTRADAILKGFASEKTSQETHAYGSATAVSSAGGGHSASISGSGGHVSGSSSGGWHASGAAIDDSSLNTETIDSAKASVRLVNSDGDVIWTSTQESKGAKYKGASADVADKIVKQLIRDIEKSEKILLSSESPR